MMSVWPVDNGLRSLSRTRPSGRRDRRFRVARAIRYQRKGFRPRTLLTSVLDSAEFPANEIVHLYHDRWEIEMGFDEVKTEMLDHTSQPLHGL
jgi:hypothetical protein